MRRILICTGVLGGGTALTFAAAALAATLLPGGTVVPVSNGFESKWVNGGVAVPMPAPPVVIDRGTRIVVGGGDAGDIGVDVPPTPEPTD